MIHIERPMHSEYFLNLRMRISQQHRIDTWLNTAVAHRRKRPFFAPRHDGFGRLMAELRLVFAHKCAYCESPLTGTQDCVSFFRPLEDASAGLDTDFSDNDYYFWLIWDWSNLYLSCITCNRYKGHLFPIYGSRARLGETGELLSQERPVLLDPCIDNPAFHLKFYEDGRVEGTSERGRETIKIFRLDRPTLRQERKRFASLLKQSLAEIYRMLKDGNQLEDQELKAKELGHFCEPNAPFSGMCRQLLYQWIADGTSSLSAQDQASTEVLSRLDVRLKRWLETPGKISINDVPTSASQNDASLDGRQVRISAQDIQPAHRKRALLVGINSYEDKHVEDLEYCVNDVTVLQQELSDLGYYVTALHDDQPDQALLPTRDNIVYHLKKICQRAEGNDLLLVHFSCHGVTMNDNGLLITTETILATILETGLRLKFVEQQMRDSSARQLVLTVDACGVGAKGTRSMADSTFIRNVYELASGFAFLAASTNQQKAHEDNNVKHGVFSHFLIKGLQGAADVDGDKVVTVDNIRDYITHHVREWHVAHGGLPQEPTMRVEGMGSIILADYR